MPKIFLFVLLLAVRPEIAQASTAFIPNARVQIDAGRATDDDFTDGAKIRRLWLGANGDLGEDFTYTVNGGLSGDDLAVQDAFFRHDGLDQLAFILGQHKESSGMEFAASNLNLPFLERFSAVTAFHARRRVGLSLWPHGVNWGAQIGAFGDNLGPVPADDRGYSLSGRAHFAPLLDKEQVLHLGAHFRHHITGEETARFRSRGEAYIPEENLVSTSRISDLDHYEVTGIEAYYAHDRLTLTGEWQQNHLFRRNERGVTQKGGFIAALWSLTGEMRGYNPQAGTYTSLKPQNVLSDGGYGAWEAGLRRSYLDLQDGGRMDSTTLGLNWYPEPHLKLTANYLTHNLSARSPHSQADPQYFLLRLQVAY